jgi:hypothetical protein
MNTEKSNWGGHREGAGRPVQGHRKKSITLWIDDDTRAWLDEKENKSRYLNELIKRDMEQAR